MNSIVEIVAAAEREVLAHTIESTRGLRAFFCQHGGEETLKSLQEEAVRRGLYRYMGQRYAKLLETVLCRTRQCISLGRIKTEDELKHYLIDLAPSLVWFRDLDLVVKDLLIDARQTGCSALSPSWLPGQQKNAKLLFTNPERRNLHHEVRLSVAYSPRCAHTIHGVGVLCGALAARDRMRGDRKGEPPAPACAAAVPAIFCSASKTPSLATAPDSRRLRHASDSGTQELSWNATKTGR